MTAVLVALADLNASGWIEHRKRDVGPYADHIIRCVRAYEVEIERLRLELFWISLGPGYTETPSDAVLEMMRVASEALKGDDKDEGDPK
jgi:hypothetical protein